MIKKDHRPVQPLVVTGRSDTSLQKRVKNPIIIRGGLIRPIADTISEIIGEIKNKRKRNPTGQLSYKQTH